MEFSTKASILHPVKQLWDDWTSRFQPVVVDTITTRFLLLFLFLLSIPLTAVIVFTVSMLSNNLDDGMALQLALSKSLVAASIDDTGEQLDMLERLAQMQPATLASSGRMCARLGVENCFVLDLQQQKLFIGDQLGMSLGRAQKFFPSLQELKDRSIGQNQFYTRLGKQIYLVRRSDVLPGKSHAKFLGLPLDRAFFDQIYSQQHSLQSEIWVVADDANATQVLLKANNALVEYDIPVKKLLKGLQLRPFIPGSTTSLTIGDVTYLVIQDGLYSSSGSRLGRILHILPLIRKQKLLSNYYVVIYFISVASLLFSVVLAMLAGRTITQPLLKFISQVNLLSRENVIKENQEVLISGVHEIQQLGEAFNRMMKRLRQEHKMRDEFVATLSHDLKVPLLAEKQTLAYMANQVYGPVSEEQAEVLGILLSSNRSCLSLVTGLLEVYRYDSGEVSLVFDSFDLGTLLVEIVNEFQALAQEKLIIMTVENTLSNSDESALVYADRLEIKRVLGNLISNAIVNTPKHGTIHCKITNAEYYGGDTIYKVSSFQHTSLKYPVKLIDRLMVTVQDSGLGFSHEDLTLLFQQFAANKSRNPMSIGLGLYNCYQVLKAHNGTVWVESTEGEGSLVSFILPQNKQAAQDRRLFRDRRRYLES